MTDWRSLLTWRLVTMCSASDGTLNKHLRSDKQTEKFNFGFNFIINQHYHFFLIHFMKLTSTAKCFGLRKLSLLSCSGGFVGCSGYFGCLGCFGGCGGGIGGCGACCGGQSGGCCLIV